MLIILRKYKLRAGFRVGVLGMKVRSHRARLDADLGQGEFLSRLGRRRDTSHASFRSSHWVSAPPMPRDAGCPIASGLSTDFLLALGLLLEHDVVLERVGKLSPLASELQFETGVSVAKVSDLLFA